MPPRKRPRRNVDSDNATEDEQEVIRPKSTRHQAIWGEEVQDILDLLSPTTNEALAEFNKLERAEKKRGVVPINIQRVARELKQLRNAKDVESLEARLGKIDSYLKECQVSFNAYIVKRSEEPDVKRYLDDVIDQIIVARRSLPGMSSLG